MHIPVYTTKDILKKRSAGESWLDLSCPPLLIGSIPIGNKCPITERDAPLHWFTPSEEGFPVHDLPLSVMLMVLLDQLTVSNSYE